MNILDYTLEPYSWQVGLRVDHRDGVLEQMLKTFCTDEFCSVESNVTPDEILRALIAREEQRTTAVGHGIAFPHARIPRLNRPFFLMGVLAEPVCFAEESIQIVCLILVPASDATTSLKVMAQLSRKLSDDSLRRSVLEASTPSELRELFDRREMRVEGPVCARDIMRLPRWSVNEDTPISQCADMMSRDHLRAVPVLDANKRIVGQITSEQLFRYGLPDFFAKLKSVSFIAEFDPFEKYFEDERQVPAGSVMHSDAQIVPLDYTIMEIVFDLAIQRYHKLYVVDSDGAWVGTIDQGTVLNNVIDF